MNTFHSERNYPMRRAIINAAMSAALLAAPAAVLAAGGHGGMGGGMSAMSGMGAGVHSSMSSGTHGLTPTTPTPTTVRGPSQTGQPKQSCQSGTGYPANTPGNSFSAPGSAFNPSGVSGSKYAGTQPQNSTNTASVAQYDVACSH
jgi:hypothetical protein